MSKIVVRACPEANLMAEVRGGRARVVPRKGSSGDRCREPKGVFGVWDEPAGKPTMTPGQRRGFEVTNAPRGLHEAEDGGGFA